MKLKLMTLCLMFCSTQNIIAQLSSLELIDESAIPLGANSPFLYYVPQMSFVDDDLYVATPKGLYKKNVFNNSEKWSKLPITDSLVVDFAMRGDTLAVLTCDILYLSTDCGENYSKVSLEKIVGENAVDSKKLYHISFHPNNTQRIYVTYGGVSYSSDFGKTWEKLPLDRVDVGGYMLSFAPVGISFNPNDSSHVVSYANYSYFNSSTVLQSCDGGTNWAFSYKSGGGVSEIYSIAFHPTDKNKMVICGVGTYLLQEQQGQRLENFHKPDSKYAQLLVELFDVVYDKRNPEILYGADMTTMTDKNVVILRSIDGGMTWNKFYTIECKNADYAIKLSIKDNILAIYTDASGIYLLDVDAVDASVPVVEEVKETNSYYDLQGRKVAHPTRGIYIKDGRKVVIKSEE